MRIMVYVALGFLTAMWSTLAFGGHAVVALALGITSLACFLAEVIRTQ